MFLGLSAHSLPVKRCTIVTRDKKLQFVYGSVCRPVGNVVSKPRDTCAPRDECKKRIDAETSLRVYVALGLCSVRGPRTLKNLAGCESVLGALIFNKTTENGELKTHFY
jgi:hypothetical protein